MGFRIIQVVLLGCFLVLAGCLPQQSKPSPELEVPSPDADSDAAQKEALQYQPKPGLTSRERFKHALKLLNKDQVEEARVELETYLLDRPNDKRARSLVKQINTPISELYPAESFAIKLSWGQTLSTLSRDYLGDVYGFYGLAKYNGIPVSEKLKVGDEIRIPATATALKAKERLENLASKPETVAPEEPLEPVVAQEEELEDELAEMQVASELPEEEAEMPAEPLSEQVTETVETEVEDSAIVEVEPAEESGILLSAIEGDPEEFIRKAVAQESYVVAAATLDELRAKQPISRELTGEAPNIYQRAANVLEQDDPYLAAKYHFEVGRMLLDQGDMEAALPALQRSVSLDESSAEAMQTFKDTQSNLAAKYHRQATNAYRKQALDEAIALWEYVLEIDPEHSAAQAYLVQANELKGKLSKIKDQ